MGSSPKRLGLFDLCCRTPILVASIQAAFVLTLREVQFPEHFFVLGMYHGDGLVIIGFSSCGECHCSLVDFMEWFLQKHLTNLLHTGVVNSKAHAMVDVDIQLRVMTHEESVELCEAGFIHGLGPPSEVSIEVWVESLFASVADVRLRFGNQWKTA